MDLVHDYAVARSASFVVTPAVTLSAAALTEVAAIDLTRGVDRGLLRLRGSVNVAALSRLVLQTRLTPTGAWRDYLVDDDLDTATLLVPFTSYTGTPLHQTPAGGSFELALDVRGLNGLRVLAQGASAGATLQIDASF